MNIVPVTLEGRHVRLELLTRAHHGALSEVGLEESIWRWTPSAVRTPEEMMAYMEQALEWQAQGSALPFATVAKDSGRVVGSTRFGNIDRANRRLEIGWTWIAKPWQRTAVNTEAKYLMLRHAFEALGAVRVQLKTDARNEKSRQAILRLGAVEEGTLRKYQTRFDGYVRDTVIFSITAEEWPAVKTRLKDRLAR